MTESILDQVAWPDNGLVPAVAQDAETGQVLMLAYVNRPALEATFASGYAHYWSRSRKRLWKKGSSSGNLQRILEVRLDCAADTLLYRVMQTGPACHTGAASCFFRRAQDGVWAEDETA